MNTLPLIMMITVESVITFLTIFFFYKVLTTKPKPEPDSYTKNDEKKR